MASEKEFADYVIEQMQGAGKITCRKMFGEYGLYCDGNIFGLICDNQVFIKPTEAGRAFIGDVKEAPPYPGAKLYFLVDDNFEDQAWINTLIQITVEELSKRENSARKKMR
jgi:TfoX/Sxy family transcriptional regulator of competence genes